MKYCYLVFIYIPKHKYDGFIYEGHYEHIPKVFSTFKGAKRFKKNYKHCSYIRRVLLR